VTKNNETLTVKARKEVILSAGTVMSPQILMLSGIGPKTHLEDIGVSDSGSVSTEPSSS
jgi:choline dehydrogenase